MILLQELLITEQKNLSLPLMTERVRKTYFTMKLRRLYMAINISFLYSRLKSELLSVFVSAFAPSDSYWGFGFTRLSLAWFKKISVAHVYIPDISDSCSACRYLQVSCSSLCWTFAHISTYGKKKTGDLMQHWGSLELVQPQGCTTAPCQGLQLPLFPTR